MFQKIFSGLILFCLVLFASGCMNKPRNPLVKAWFCAGKPTKEQKLDAIYKYGAQADVKMDAANFIDLQPDSTFTCFFPLYNYGRWVIKDNELVLIDHDRNPLELVINVVNDQELICTDIRNKILYHFNGFNNSFKSAADNPFSRQNNQWRLKAEHKESEQELTARIRNHFRYWEKYFAWGKTTNISSLDYSETPGPLKMYGNGFGVQYLDYQLPEWKNVFYDTTDCRKAYESVYYLLARHKVKWPEADNTWERMESAFKQAQGW
jgi:hypothetical protein